MIANVDALTYSYPTSDVPVLDDLSTTIAAAELTLLAGPSAGGKSTLLRAFNGLVPQFYGGRYRGSVTVCGLDPATTPARRMATVAGMVFQEPETQAVAEQVEDEIAFGMEQHGIPRDEMVRRCDHLLDRLGIAHLRYRSIATLSGGERQRVTIAAVLALQPPLLLLDEPTSQLDPEGAESVLATVESLARTGLGVIVAEHRLDRLLPHADRLLWLAGRGLAETTPVYLHHHLLHPPPLGQLALRLGWDTTPRTIDEARARLAAGPGVHLDVMPSATTPGDILLGVDSLSVRYGETEALATASLVVREGEVVALVGPNGSGKSTLLRTIAGLVEPASGNVRFRSAPAPDDVPSRTAFAALVPQDPALALYRDTVADEIGESVRLRRLPSAAAPRVLDSWRVATLAARDPRELSVGQQQRVAIATMLAHRPPVWMLDEPTRGVDADARETIASALRAHAASGGAAIVATHDVETAAAFATRVVGLEAGRIAFDLPVREALGHGGPLPTQVGRLIPGALTADEVTLAC